MSEQHRHQCECRHYIARARKQGLGWFKGFIQNWKRWPDSLLQKDFWIQWRAGNTGKYGEWVAV
jgi:hypothetical protein